MPVGQLPRSEQTPWLIPPRDRLAHAQESARSLSRDARNEIANRYSIFDDDGQKLLDLLPARSAADRGHRDIRTGYGKRSPGAHTTADRDGDEWVITGQKTFVTSAINTNFVIVATRTDSDASSRGFSLIVVESGTPRKIGKMGLHAQDTAKLLFDNVRVPSTNLLRTEGQGFLHLVEGLPRERMSIAAGSTARIEATFGDTKAYCFPTPNFGKPIDDFQNTRFVLAEMATELDVARAYTDKCVLALQRGKAHRRRRREEQMVGQTIYGGSTKIMKKSSGAISLLLQRLNADGNTVNGGVMTDRRSSSA